MSAADIFGLVVSLAVLAYLVYALFRGRELLAMSGQGIAQVVFYAVALVALGYPLGLWMARIYTSARPAGRLLAGVEGGFLRLVGAEPKREQNWKSYGRTVLVFSVLFWALLYLIQRAQGHLFLNPDHMKGVPAHLSLNTAASFVTNTNWQFYGGEYTMSYLTQMAGLAVQNFVSAAVGIAVLAAVVRGISQAVVGDDRQLLGRPLPHARVPAAASGRRRRGHSSSGRACRRPSTGTRPRRRSRARHQTIARGPVASQIAIKQLGHERRRLLQLELGRPVREPERALELHRDAGDPADPGGGGLHVREDGARAPPRVGGVRGDVRRLRDRHRRQPAGRAARLRGAAQLGRQHHAGHGQSGGNMSDKEVRFGLANSSIWTVATSDASNGSVNDGFDAQTPAGGAVPLVNLFLGEVIFGGVGSGLYGMFFYIVLAVFVAGLMVGRTPEWLGKKIDAREIKYAALGALFVPTMVSDPGRPFDRDEERTRVDLQQRRTRLHRDALRVRLAVEQQRQRLRRLRTDQLQLVLRDDRDAARPIRADVRGARTRRRIGARRRSCRSRPGRSVRTGRRSSCCSSA